MPWVNHVYVVTADQVPKWLDVSHPKLTMVSHREIFPAEYLPTFNSSAIEARLHHIPGLSEHYLYFNDDVCAGRPLQPTVFFTPNGLSKFYPALDRFFDAGPVSEWDIPVVAAAKNNRALIRESFGRTFQHTMRHTAHPQRRSVQVELEERFGEEHRATLASRFRSRGDLTPAASLHHYYAYVTGRAVQAEVSYGYHYLRADDFGAWMKRMSVRRPEMLCFNDHRSDDDTDYSMSDTIDVIRRYFPVPSAFELS
jgi:hypothetical protein